MNDRLLLAATVWDMPLQGKPWDLTGQARTAESLGYHSFWLPENHFGGERSIPAPLMLLAAVAAATRRIKLGSTSYLLPIRHPLHAAEEVAVLDRLSGGRVILGVGRGVQDKMFQAFAVDRKDKRKRFSDNLAVMRRAWRGEPVIPGDVDTILAPLPIQQPHPPIWVAAFGPLAIKQAGSLGLPYLASPVETIDQLEANYLRHRQFVTEAGHADVDVVPVMRTVFVSDSPGERNAVCASLSRAPASSMRKASANLDDWSIVGDRPEVKDKIAQYRETLGMTHLIVRGRITGMDNDAWVRSLATAAELTG